MADDPNARPPLFNDATDALVRKMLQDPIHSKKFLRILKDANPGVAIPAVDLEDQIAAAAAAAEKKTGELQQTVQRMDAERRIERERQALRERGFTPADITLIEARMQKPEEDPEALPPSYALAARVLKAERQLATPTPQINQKPREPVTKDIPKDVMESVARGETGPLNQHARQVAHQHVEELKQQRAQAH